MIAGPGIAGAIAEFENESDSDPSKQSRGPDLLHHEQVNHLQCTFKTQVQSLVEVFTECGNPFIDESGDLLVLDTRNIMTPEVVSTVNCIETLGQEQYKLYCKERLDTKVKSDVIPRNKLSLFRSPVKRLKTKHQMTMSTVKQNCALFSQLYISSQVRNGDLDKKNISARKFASSTCIVRIWKTAFWSKVRSYKNVGITYSFQQFNSCT